MQMTFDDYDLMVEKFKKVDTDTMWPTKEQLDMMEENPDQWIPFLCYLVEKSEEPDTDEEIASRKMMKAFLNKHLELIEDEDDE